jgi:hypothetical protein
MWTLFIEHATLQPMAVSWKREAPCCWMLGCVWEYSFHPHTNPSGCAVGSSLWAGVVYSSRCGCSLQRSLPEGYTTHMGTAPVMGSQQHIERWVFNAGAGTGSPQWGEPVFPSNTTPLVVRVVLQQSRSGYTVVLRHSAPISCFGFYPAEIWTVEVVHSLWYIVPAGYSQPHFASVQTIGSVRNQYI